MNKTSEKLFAAGIVAAAALTGLVVFANSPFDIEFPIAELGGCTDKTECKTYCDNEENLEACQNFAEKHGLGADHEEIDKKLKELEEDGGPGGCAENEKNPALACKRYCDDAARIRECVTYAKEHKLFEGRELEEAEKVAAALERGVKLPAQCENARDCRSVCDNPADLESARACFNFAAEAGLLPPEVNREQAEKFFTAFAEGKTPFKSFSEMRQCDNPESDEVMEKCINFAIEAGLVPPEEAAMIKKTGGKGPGGCRGRTACEAYCEANGEECFAFAEKHDILRPEDKERMREGMDEMREAMKNAPPEAEACIRSAIPEFDLILEGKKFASPALGEKMRVCFESIFQSSGEGEAGHPRESDFGPGEARDGPRGGMNFPPEVKQCLTEKFGDDFFSAFGKERPSPDMEAKMSECFKAAFGDRGNREEGGTTGDHEGEGDNFRKDRPCPAMPTEISCSSEQDSLRYEVPGCGSYSRCVPKRGLGAPPPGDFSHEGGGQSEKGDSGSYGEEFGKQYGEEFRREFNREAEIQAKDQYDAEYKRQYETEYEQVRAEAQGQLTSPPPLPLPSHEGSEAPAPSSPAPQGDFNAAPPPAGDFHPPSSFMLPSDNLLANVLIALRRLLNLE